MTMDVPIDALREVLSDTMRHRQRYSWMRGKCGARLRDLQQWRSADVRDARSLIAAIRVLQREAARG